jgi:hypothetical protein
VGGTASTTTGADATGNWTIIESVILSEGVNQIVVVDPGPPVSSVSAGTVTLDTIAPSVTGITVEPTPATAGVVRVSIGFSEKMNSSTNPIITVTTNNGEQVYTVTANPSWTAPEYKEFVASFTLPVDAANGPASVGISGARDDIGNVMPPNPSIGSFTIDTNSMGGKPRLVRPNPERTIDTIRYLSTLTPQFEWTGVSGATKYVVHVVEAVGNAPYPDVDSDQWDGQFPNNGWTYEATSPWTISRPLTNGGTYLWGVVAYDNGNNVMTSETSGRFGIRTDSIRLAAPANNGYTNSMTPEFSWLPGISPAWTYDLQVSTSPTFSPLHPRSQIGLAGSSMTIEASTDEPARYLTEEGVFYWRIRARDEYGNVNSDSETRRLNIDFTPPQPPEQVSPANEAVLSKTASQDIEFKWTQVTDADRYILQIKMDSSDFTTGSILSWEVSRGNSFTSAAHTVSTLNRDGTYFWRVLSVDKAGNRSDRLKTDGSPYFPSIPSRQFLVDSEPPNGDLITLVSPINDAYVNKTMPKFDWTYGGVATDVQSYELWVSTRKQFTPEAGHPVSEALWTWEVKNTTTTVAYTIDKPLTGEGQFYWKVRVRDKAGNLSNFSYYETFIKDTLPPTKPSISEPASGTVVNSKSITVKVRLSGALTGSSSSLPERQLVKIYSVHGRADAGENYERNNFVLIGQKQGNFGEQEVSVTVNVDSFNGGDADGPIKISATATDEAGNESLHASAVSLVIDLKAPQIKQLILTSDHPGNSSSVDPDYSGRIICSIEFTEPMDKTKNPLVQLQSETGKFLPDAEPLAAPNSSWSEDGTVYTCTFKVPLGTGYNGLATVYIRGDLVDLAGRTISPNPAIYQKYFRIDTAPKLKLKIFYNPTDERDLIISVESSEILAAIPRLEVDTGTATVKPLVSEVINDLYVAKYSITGKEAGEIDVTAYGTDLSGNVGKGVLTFVIENLFTECYKRVASADGQLTIDITPDAVDRDMRIMVLPSEDLSIEQGLSKSASGNEMQGLAKIAALSSESFRAPAGQGLTRVSRVYDIGPANLKLAAQCPVRLEVDPELAADLDSSKIGVYRYQSGRWVFLGRDRSGNTVSTLTNGGGRIALFHDGSAPAVNPVYPSEGQEVDNSRPRMVMEIMDLGSGLNSESVDMRIDGLKVRAIWDDTISSMVFVPERPLSPGDHVLEISASDNVANSSAKVVVAFAAPAPFGIDSAYCWPNPATGGSVNIDFSLSQAAAMAEIRIFDRSGDIVRTYDGLAGFKGANRQSWDLLNEDGEEVSNGVYYARVRATDSTGTVERFVKIAVLR